MELFSENRFEEKLAQAKDMNLFLYFNGQDVDELLDLFSFNRSYFLAREDNLYVSFFEVSFHDIRIQFKQYGQKARLLNIYDDFTRKQYQISNEPLRLEQVFDFLFLNLPPDSQAKYEKFFFPKLVSFPDFATDLSSCLLYKARQSSESILYESLKFENIQFSNYEIDFSRKKHKFSFYFPGSSEKIGIFPFDTDLSSTWDFPTDFSLTDLVEKILSHNEKASCHYPNIDFSSLLGKDLFLARFLIRDFLVNQYLESTDYRLRQVFDKKSLEFFPFELTRSFDKHLNK